MRKKLLQIAVCVACLVPLSAGLWGALSGIDNVNPVHDDADSQFRYLSGLLLGIGISFLTTVARIEQQGARFRLLTFIVFIGGLCRLVGFFLRAFPGPVMLFGLTMEVVVTPLLCLWQHRVAERFADAKLMAG